MYNGALRGDIKIQINQIQGEIFKKRGQESNLSKSDEYDTHAKKIFQYDWNSQSDEFGKIHMVRNEKN